MDGGNILKLNPSPELTIFQSELGSWDNLNHLLICNTTRSALLIDPFDGQFWSDIIKKEGINTVKIVLTHSHWDHTRGVVEFLNLNPGTEIYVHQLESERGWNGPDTHRWSHPPFTFVDFGFGALSFEIHCTPGHTPGHITLIGHGVIISGDCLFLGRCGRTDLYGGDMYSMWESQMHLHLRFEKLPNNWIILPGHRYPINDENNPTYISLEFLLKHNPAIKKQSFEEFSKLSFLEFDDSLSEKAKRQKAKDE